MSTNRVKRIEQILDDLIGQVIEAESGSMYTGTIAKDYPSEWRKLLRVAGLYDSRKSDEIKSPEFVAIPATGNTTGVIEADRPLEKGQKVQLSGFGDMVTDFVVKDVKKKDRDTWSIELDKES